MSAQGFNAVPVALSELSLGPLPVARPRLPPLEAIRPYLERIDQARWYSNFGPLLIEFEARLAARFALPTAVCTVANGTQALTLGLQAMGVRPGTLCAMPAFTFVATAHAAVAAGLIPWFLDVDPRTWMLDPAQVTRELVRAPGDVGAVIPVSAFGAPVDMAAWAAFREATGVAVLVDAAAGFDAVDRAPVPVTVSLHATKALGIGEGGVFASEDTELVDRVRQLTTFGFRGGRTAHVAATNAKISEYACAVGLAGLDAWPATRTRLRAVAQHLRIALTRTPQVRFQPGWGPSWVAATCTAALPEGRADAVERALEAQGVATRRWWDRGCHRAPAFADAPRTALPTTERLVESTLGLPYALDMDVAEVARLSTALAQALRAP